MRERLERLRREVPPRDVPLERRPHHGDGVLLVDPSPFLPPEGRRPVDEHDAADVRLGRQLEGRPHARTEPRPRVGLAHGRHRDTLGEILLDRLEHGPEEIPLVPILMAEGPAGHAGPAHQLLHRGAGIAALGEQIPRRPDEPLLGLTGLLGLAVARLFAPAGCHGVPPSSTGREPRQAYSTYVTY